MTDRGACLVRGCTAAVFATLAAALSHIKTGGIALHPVLVLFPLSISALACVAVAWCVGAGARMTEAADTTPSAV